MTITETDTSTLEHLEFAIICELFLPGYVRCSKEAIALVQIKCAKCEKIVEFYMCVTCLDKTVTKGILHNGACMGMAWYVTHLAVK